MCSSSHAITYYMPLPPSSPSTIKLDLLNLYSPHHNFLIDILNTMASKVFLFLAFFVLFSGCLAFHQQQRPLWQQQQNNQCQIQRIEAQEPNQSFQAEAGVTEFWNSNNQEFQCAGVEFIRHRIQPGGLLLPSYVSTALLSFVERGRGVRGVILPGCPETFEYSPEQQFSGQGSQQRGQAFQDRHQKVENLNQGDVGAIPAGSSHWIYNDGNEELVIVVFLDSQNRDNQLDQYYRRFFLAGGKFRSQQQQGQQQQQQQHQGQKQSQQYQGQQQQSLHDSGNIFDGFDVEFIAEAFNVDRETAQKLQGQQDQRGHIVNVQQDLQIVRPPQSRQQQQQQHQGGQQQHQQQPGARGSGRGGSSNGFDETICSLKLRENIENPTQADFVNPQAGWIANLNSFKFPVLQQLELSVERGQLYPNAIHTPHWTLNAHNLLYLTEGTLRIQIVNNNGESVFDDEVQKGQVVVIPQNFAAVRRAGQQGAKWISFRTNDNALTANLAGRVSAIRSMPVDVVANAYQLSRDEAQRLKFNQQEAHLLSPSSSRSQGQGWFSA